MRRGHWVLVALFLVGVLLAPAARAAEPSSATITPTSGPVSWNGQFYAAGANVSNFAGDQVCEGDPGAVPGVHECDVFQLTVEVPDGHWGQNKGGVRIDLSWASADNDFDVYVFRADENWQPVGNAIGSSAQGATTEEHVLLFAPEGRYLIRTNPFSVVASDYQGKVEFFSLAPIPTVDGGVEQFRASSTGYLSYSEPHIAVNPLDPNHLVAGSKMYQHLEAYKFKIGTFVSLDGGRTWADNGHLPGYPAQTGNEGDDYYITSDVWMAFDDEGSSYVMVLDAPPGSPTGAGWGMTLHKSTDGGRSWSGRIPIEEKRDLVTKTLFLSDKNTLAVDNFGPDRDGKTGNMYACWSEDAPVANLFVAVKRSTDGGLTWGPNPPTDVSGVDRTVIGCYLAVGPPASPGGAGVVYVFWLDFSGNGRIRMAKSTDGGVSWSAPRTVAAIRQIPRIFPNSAFRNLSLPSADVDPRNGAVYVTWADYHATQPGEPCPPDEDAPEGQVCDADILLARSTDAGQTWSAPVRVNQDAVGNGKDQFQQQLAVTPHGQLNVMWFDRRNDPQNFYIDTFFARSNDGGASWGETRVTKSMWDPSINPPISPSGHFIGDYQGIAATDCGAVPFWQDTTLANLPVSDPRYSTYQEAFSAVISNTRKFGGAPVAGANCPKPPKRPPRG